MLCLVNRELMMTTVNVSGSMTKEFTLNIKFESMFETYQVCKASLYLIVLEEQANLTAFLSQF